jgi:hypothetical protein
MSETVTVKSPTIAVTTVTTPIQYCPLWMNRLWKKAKDRGLENLQKRIESMAEQRGCVLTEG